MGSGCQQIVRFPSHAARQTLPLLHHLNTSTLQPARRRVSPHVAPQHARLALEGECLLAQAVRLLNQHLQPLAAPQHLWGEGTDAPGSGRLVKSQWEPRTYKPKAAPPRPGRLWRQQVQFFVANLALLPL